MASRIDKFHEMVKLQQCVDSIADSVKTLSVQCLSLARRLQTLVPKETLPSQKLMKIAEVQELLSISRPMVYKMVYEGNLEAIKISTRGIRITESSVTGLITEGKVLPADIEMALEWPSPIKKQDPK